MKYRALLGLPLAASMFACTQVSAAIVVHWKLDEASGTTAADSATADGTQNGTSASATPQWLPGAGVIGGGLRFGATAQADVDEAVSHTAATSLLSAYPATISSWIRTSSTTAYRQTFVFLGDQTTSAEYLQTSMEGSGGGSTATAAARNTSFSGATGGTAVNDGAWHHVVGVYDSPTLRTVYVDGVKIGVNTASVTFPDTTRLSLAALMRSSPTDALTGDLDDVGVWNTALSARRVALVHGLGRFGVDLADPSIDLVEGVFDTQSGSATAGSENWQFASGLPSTTIGATGTANSQPYIVLDASGNGVMAIPEPGSIAGLLAAGTLGLLCRSRRRPS